MAISLRRYVRITSGVGGGAAVPTRDLIGRILTGNPLTPADTILEFGGASSVADYYGADSLEARIAGFYFSYVSPAIGMARAISFGRYNATGSAARLIGGTGLKSLGEFTALSAATLALRVDGTPLTVSGIDLSAATSLAAVATAIQTEIADTVPLAAATVAYDAVTRRFTLTAAGLTVGRIELEEGTALSDLLQWGDPSIVSPSVQPQTAVQAFGATIDLSDNFGALAVYPRPDLPEMIDLAELVAAENVKFQLMVGVSREEAETWAAALAGYAGTGITLSPFAEEYPELFPMVQLAATDYNARNGVVNYMFKQVAGLTPTVDNDLEANLLDSYRVNYYGLTKTAGQNLAFYQRGYLQGGPTAPVDMSVHGNEQWLKDYIGTEIMSLLVSANRVPANEAGRGQVLNAIQVGVDQALFNGTFSVGKTLTNAQRAAVTQMTGDPLAWHQLQQAGYWVDCRIVPVTGEGGVTEYRALYTLIYSKDDAIRSVDGTHTLI